MTKHHGNNMQNTWKMIKSKQGSDADHTALLKTKLYNKQKVLQPTMYTSLGSSFRPSPSGRSIVKIVFILYPKPNSVLFLQMEVNSTLMVAEVLYCMVYYLLSPGMMIVLRGRTSSP